MSNFSHFPFKSYNHRTPTICNTFCESPETQRNILCRHNDHPYWKIDNTCIKKPCRNLDFQGNGRELLFVI